MTFRSQLSQPLDSHCRLEAPAGRRRITQQALYEPSQRACVLSRRPMQLSAVECNKPKRLMLAHGHYLWL